MSAPTEHDPSTCTACRGTGELTSGLGGEPHRVRCPWCEGTGRFDAAVTRRPRRAMAIRPMHRPSA